MIVDIRKYSFGYNLLIICETNVIIAQLLEWNSKIMASQCIYIICFSQHTYIFNLILLPSMIHLCIRISE